jgi:hypothetical protein
MDACGNRFAITRSRPQAYYYYYYVLERKENAPGTREPYSPPFCVNHVPGLFCKLSPRLLSVGPTSTTEYSDLTSWGRPRRPTRGTANGHPP